MADPAHLEIAKKGTEAIALWHRSHPEEPISLTRANLIGASASRPPGRLTRFCPRPLMAQRTA